MKPISAALLACGLLSALLQGSALPTLHGEATNQEPRAAQKPEDAGQRALFSKVDAYVRCLNSLSPEIHHSRTRYFIWAARSGPTGAERNIDGVVAIDNPSDCREAVGTVNDVTPHDPELEATASAYVAAITKLHPLLREAGSYEHDKSYKDDNMAKGRALHPPLQAAFDEFFAADQKLRDLVDPVIDDHARQDLTALENRDGRTLRFEVNALMVDARALVSAIRTAPDTDRITAALSQYETALAAVTALDEAAHNNDVTGVDQVVLNDAKSLGSNAKFFLRRLRDKIPYTGSEQVLLNTPDGRGGLYGQGLSCQPGKGL
ncbi:MAG: YiiG family protein [Alphaproteobacteria bacterium]|nr:YiiG family protein [Alphaproteobacteria bacterium]